MQTKLTREDAIELLRKHNKEPFHILHGLTVGGVLKWYANELGYGDEAGFWEICGILHDMEKVLFAADELTGLIWAAAKMRPSKSTKDMEVSSLKKKFKDKKFAAGCSRDVITKGAENLGWELPKLMEMTILAMRSCEDSVAEEMKEMGLAE